MSDDELYALILQKQRDTKLSFGDPLVYRVTVDSIAKQVWNGERNESYTMQYVAAQTSILVPTVRRVLPASDPGKHWIVMDYVEGQTLFELWPHMSWMRRIWVVWTLRQYLSQLRHMPLPNPGVPGPSDGSGKPLRCFANHFPRRGAGPFNSYDDLARWHDYQRYCHQVRRHQLFRELWKCPKFDTSSPLVFCHGDLHLRNILVDNDNRVWLLDWENAGAFPAWWDYVHLAVWTDAQHPLLRLPKSFAIFLPFIAGDYGRLYTEYWKNLTAQIARVESEALEKEEGYFDRLAIVI